MSDYKVVIGLEVHVELSTKTKMFCSCSTQFGSPPNTQVCPVCLGLPGVLPVANKKAIDYLLKAALALNCKISPRSKFDRKNYFYPDMPKNYQISQYDLPLAYDGYLEIELNGESKKIGIERIHQEEDTGKSIHTDSIDRSLYTLLDFNRAGVPLLEIVTKPDMSSPEEAYEYLKNLRAILFCLGISDCKMEEGSLRCDANISVNKPGQEALSSKVEIKNMNSFKSVQRALAYEINRQIECQERGEKIVQSTRGWIEGENKTVFMRSKEFAHDYRYFPEPDLLPMVIDDKWLKEIKDSLPELPKEKKIRYIKEFSLSPYESSILAENKFMADFFEKSLETYKKPGQVVNWLSGDISKYLNSKNLEINSTKLTPENLSEMLSMIDNKVISGKIGKDIIVEMMEKGTGAKEIVEKRGLLQISDEGSLRSTINEILDKNEDSVQSYLAGKIKVTGFLVGQIMRETKGKANPQMTNKILAEELEKRRMG